MIFFSFIFIRIKSADGLTPFMYAVSLRAYEAARILLAAALAVSAAASGGSEYARDLLATRMICPVGSRAHQAPLYAICSGIISFIFLISKSSFGLF